MRSPGSTGPNLLFTDGLTRGERLEEFVCVPRPPNIETYAACASWTRFVDLHATVYRDVACEIVETQSLPQEPLPRNETEARVSLRSTLEDAIESAIGDATHVAVSTGGGVDSGILLALAVHVGKRLGRRVSAVSLDYDGGQGDDRPYLAALQRKLGCNVVRVPPARGAAHLDLLDGIDAAPFYVPTGPMEVAVASAARAAGAECLLSGTGGDQLFDGRASDLSRLVRSGRIIEAVRQAGRLRGFGRPRSPALRWVARPIIAEWVPRWIRVQRALRTMQPPMWGGPAMARLEARRRFRTKSLLRSLPDRGPYESEIFAGQRTQVAWFRHQVALAADIRCATPYFDPRVIALARGIPREWHLTGGVRRGLLRETARDLIPRVLFERLDKASFMPALAEFYEAVGGDGALRHYADVEALASFGVVRPETFRTVYRSANALESPSAWVDTWCVLATERFARARH